MDERTQYVYLNRTFLENRKFLSSNACCIWIELKGYWWSDSKTKKPINAYVCPSVTNIMDWTGIKSKSTIRNAIEELLILGFIKNITPRFNQTSLYYLDENPEVTVEKINQLKAFKEELSKKKTKTKEKISE